MWCFQGPVWYACRYYESHSSGTCGLDNGCHALRRKHGGQLELLMHPLPQLNNAQEISHWILLHRPSTEPHKDLLTLWFLCVWWPVLILLSKSFLVTWDNSPGLDLLVQPIPPLFHASRARPLYHTIGSVPSSVSVSDIKPKQQLSDSLKSTIMTKACYSVFDNLSISLCLFFLISLKTYLTSLSFSKS